QCSCYTLSLPVQFPPPFPTRRSSDPAPPSRTASKPHERYRRRDGDGARGAARGAGLGRPAGTPAERGGSQVRADRGAVPDARGADRKSTRLNSSHLVISYAVFCLKKK